MDLKIGHIEIFIKDPNVSKSFYKDILGFEQIEIQSDVYIWLRSQDVTILLRPGNPTGMAVNYQSSEKGIVLYTNDLNKTSEELKSRGLEFKGTDGSDKCLTFTDPDGNWFQLVNPSDH